MDTTPKTENLAGVGLTPLLDGFAHRLRSWLEVDVGIGTDIGRTLGFLMKDDLLLFRMMGRMRDGRRMSKFVEIDVDEPLGEQIEQALCSWNADAGF